MGPSEILNRMCEYVCVFCVCACFLCKVCTVQVSICLRAWCKDVRECVFVSNNVFWIQEICMLYLHGKCVFGSTSELYVCACASVCMYVGRCVCANIGVSMCACVIGCVSYLFWMENKEEILIIWLEYCHYLNSKYWKIDSKWLHSSHRCFKSTLIQSLKTPTKLPIQVGYHAKL